MQLESLVPSFGSFDVCLSLEYTPRDQYRNKEEWALGVPLAVKASLKLRPRSQSCESERPHTDRARTPVAQIGGLVLPDVTTPKGGGTLSCESQQGRFFHLCRLRTT